MSYNGPERRSDVVLERPHCEEHSGVMTWLKGIAALLTLASGLLTYSVLGQAPDLRARLDKAVSNFEKREVEVNGKLQVIQEDITELKGRVSKLEEP